LLLLTSATADTEPEASATLNEQFAKTQTAGGSGSASAIPWQDNSAAHFFNQALVWNNETITYDLKMLLSRVEKVIWMCF
jgi:hypothetical protein